MQAAEIRTAEDWATGVAFRPGASAIHADTSLDFGSKLQVAMSEGSSPNATARALVSKLEIAVNGATSTSDVPQALVAKVQVATRGVASCCDVPQAVVSKPQMAMSEAVPHSEVPQAFVLKIQVAMSGVVSPSGVPPALGANFPTAMGAAEATVQVAAGSSHTTEEVDPPDLDGHEMQIPKIPVETEPIIKPDTTVVTGAGPRVEEEAVVSAASLHVPVAASSTRSGEPIEAVIHPDKEVLETATLDAQRSKPKRQGKVAGALETASVAKPCDGSQSVSNSAVNATYPQMTTSVSHADGTAGDHVEVENVSEHMLSPAAQILFPGKTKDRTIGKAPPPSAAIGGAVAMSENSPAPVSFSDPSTRHAAQPSIALSGVHVPAGASVTGVASSALLTNNVSGPVEVTSPAPSLGRVGAPPSQSAGTDALRGNDQQIVASSPTHLDVGVFDGTHGWLRIRAELDPAGAVNASLTANSSAHSLLKSDLPEMAKYLSAETIVVSKIAVHRFDAVNTTSTGTSGGNAAGFAQSNQGGREAGTSKSQFGAKDDVASDKDASSAVWSPGPGRGFGGGWVNVCA